MRSTIICVDDDKWLLGTISEQLNQWLGEKYTIEKALSGAEALEIIDDCLDQDSDISLIISDYIMPGMKGDEFLEQAKQKSPKTRRIMLTGFAAIDGIANAINKAGIYRYMSKPWDAKDMMLTVLQAIRSYEQDKQTDLLNKKNGELYGALVKVNNSLQLYVKQTIVSLTKAVELRDGHMFGHAERVAKYALCLAGELGMSDIDKATLETSALLHDVGKLGFTDAELEASRNLKRYVDKNAALMQAEKAKEILSHMDERYWPGVLYHAERVDGRGAFGMDGTSIPQNAKIIGLCDYYDILKSTRDNASSEEVLLAIELNSGKVFDEALVQKFVALDFD